MKGKKGNNVLKSVLENRVGNGLPSNFNYKMMNRIRLEAVKQKKRRRLISWLCLISVSLLLVSFGAYILISLLDFNFTHYIPQIEKVQLSGDILLFYWYIAFLVLVLLGFDYWMRRHKRKTTHE